MSDPQDSSDPSIPVLSEILLPGKPSPARAWPEGAAPGVSPEPVPTAQSSTPDLFAAGLAGRLRSRMSAYLQTEGREQIEARCRDALSEHETRLIARLTQEVTRSLEARLDDWVREALDEAQNPRPD